MSSVNNIAAGRPSSAARRCNACQFVSHQVGSSPASINASRAAASKFRGLRQRPREAKEDLGRGILGVGFPCPAPQELSGFLLGEVPQLDDPIEERVSGWFEVAPAVGPVPADDPDERQVPNLIAQAAEQPLHQCRIGEAVDEHNDAPAVGGG